MTWQARAECRDLDPEEFERGGPEAAAACQRCPVRAECLAAAMVKLSRNVYPPGYWAGLTDARRAYLRWSGWQPGDPLPEVRPAPAGQKAVSSAEDTLAWATETFVQAGREGTRRAARRYGVHSMRLYRAWDHFDLGRPSAIARRAS